MASKFQGQGTYGCIYAPAFTCKIPDPNPGERVSKIFKTPMDNMNEETFNDEYTKEKRILERVSPDLNIIDPMEDYYIYKYHECEINKAVNIKEIEKTCRSTNTPYPYIFKSRAKDDFIFALNFKKGNIDLFTILKKEVLQLEQLKMLLTQLKNVIQGIHLLNKNGIYHLDIKTGNIIFQNGLFKIIDFGLCKKLNRANRSAAIFLNMYEHCWPVETILLATNDQRNIAKHVADYNASRYITELKIMFPNINTNLPTAVVKKIYDGIDVWGFGLILYEVYRKMPNTAEFRSIKSSLSAMINKILSSKDRLNSGSALKFYTEFVNSYSFLPSPLQELHIKMDRVNKERTERQTREMKRMYQQNAREVSKRINLRLSAIEITLKLMNDLVTNKFIWTPRQELFFFLSNDWYGEELKSSVESPSLKINLWKYCQNNRINIVKSIHKVLNVMEYFHYCIGNLPNFDAIMTNVKALNIVVIYIQDGYVLIRPMDKNTPQLYEFRGMNFSYTYTGETVFFELKKFNIKLALSLSKCDPSGVKRKASEIQKSPQAKRVPSVWITKK